MRHSGHTPLVRHSNSVNGFDVEVMSTTLAHALLALLATACVVSASCVGLVVGAAQVRVSVKANSL